MNKFIGILLGFVVGLASTVQAGPRFKDSHPVKWQGKSPQRYAVHGLDVARFQPAINWRKARRAGIDFAFIKLTEGGDLRDPMFDAHWKGAGLGGVARGAYHFYYFCTPAETQARWFVRNLPRAKGMLPPVLDLEWNPYSPTCTRRPDGAEVRRQARVFLDFVEKSTGQRPIVYTTPEFYRQTQIFKLRGTEFWLRSTAKTPDKTYPGQKWSFWQYTGTGIVPGVEGGVDINVFAGTKRDWRKWYAARQR
ncbi:MAG: GH25 family lysozyme [Paracoccaceae bacterium]